MKRLIGLLSILALLCCSCMTVSVTKPGLTPQHPPTEIRIKTFGVDPKIGRLETPNMKLENAEYSSEPGVRMWEMTLDKIAEYALKAGAASAGLPTGPILPP